MQKRTKILSTLYWINQVVYAALLIVMLYLGSVRPVAADAPLWPDSSVVYCVYPSIFSPGRNFAGVTAQLKRLKDLGVTVVWLMPITPIGRAVNGHPSVGSPYCVQDYFAVNPEYGTSDDLHKLVQTAHKLGLKVILDEVLNHTSWDNALITQHPEYYVHSDGNAKDQATIVQAFTYRDVAQLNYANADLRVYMTQMLRFWLTRFEIDGFRFDSADNPGGPERKIPADFWQALGQSLRQTKPDVLLLGECQTPDLALKPFTLDYGWRVYGTLKEAVTRGDASRVEPAWQRQVSDFPSGMKHLSIQDNWDTPRDVSTFGGEAGAIAAAVFNFTSAGVPLVYNGMEIGNAAGGVNPHAVIEWKGGNPRFSDFYRALAALRRKNPALQQGATTWLANSVPTQVLTYMRTGGGSEFLIEINLTKTAAQGMFNTPAGAGWTEVSLSRVDTVRTHAAPPLISLPPQDFAIFRRRAAKR